MRKTDFRTGADSSHPWQHRPAGDDAANDEVLAVLVDQRNGHEYYVSMIDTILFRGREYSVMYNYEPDDGTHANPEIVIMRHFRTENGEQYFTSVRNKRELDAVFNLFYERFEQAMN